MYVAQRAPTGRGANRAMQQRLVRNAEGLDQTRWPWRWRPSSKLPRNSGNPPLNRKDRDLLCCALVAGSGSASFSGRANAASSSHAMGTIPTTAPPRASRVAPCGRPGATNRARAHSSVLRRGRSSPDFRPAAQPVDSDPESTALALSEGDLVTLGKSDLKVSAIGIGAWSWGDRSGYWGYGKGYDKDDTRKTYEATINAGINFIDTAEVYGFGMSEEFLGEYMKQTSTSPIVATKFAPLPWRLKSDDVVSAAKSSLNRLKLEKMGLYMIHWPGFGINGFSNKAYLDGLAMCKEQGLCDAVGVSNFNAERLISAYDQLESRGVVLASNQVQYSLMYRAPETNGVLGVCKEKGITLVAYSPLAQGILTGKYTKGNRPSGPRSATFTDQRLDSVQPLLSLMRDIGSAHGDKSLAQVALNWNICKGTVPIPGAKTVDQLAEAAGALGWRLTDEEVKALDDASSRVLPFTGAPFENW